MLFKTKFLSLVFALVLPFMLIAQKDAPIELINASFEDFPKAGETPNGWYNCGPSAESPPDIQPGSFAVMKAPSHGETFLGLVVRDNDSWESVGQRLSRPLEINKCYEFGLDLSRSELYLSVSRTTGTEVNYATPAKIRIWGGMGYCDKKEILAETSVITNTRWLTYNFRFNPKKGSYTYIIIESYFKTPTLFPYNGNILIDNATSIRPVPCDDRPKVPEKTDSITKQPVNNTVGGKPKDKTPKPTPNNGTLDVAAPKIDTPAVNKYERKNLKKGGIIRLENVYFDSDKYEIKSESEPALEEIHRFLFKNTDVVVEIGGHTNNVPETEFCDKLSTERAKAVANWLAGKGIGSDRVQYKGYGKRNPIISNSTAAGRRRNQRVEIKILSING